MHLGRFALGGAGLVFCETTAVEERARRTHGDLGLWNDDQVEPLSRITNFLKADATVKRARRISARTWWRWRARS